MRPERGRMRRALAFGALAAVALAMPATGSADRTPDQLAALLLPGVPEGFTHTPEADAGTGPIDVANAGEIIGIEEQEILSAGFVGGYARMWANDQRRSIIVDVVRQMKDAAGADELLRVYTDEVRRTGAGSFPVAGIPHSLGYGEAQSLPGREMHLLTIVFRKANLVFEVAVGAEQPPTPEEAAGLARGQYDLLSSIPDESPARGPGLGYPIGQFVGGVLGLCLLGGLGALALRALNRRAGRQRPLLEGIAPAGPAPAGAISAQPQERPGPLPPEPPLPRIPEVVDDVVMGFIGPSGLHGPMGRPDRADGDDLP